MYKLVLPIILLFSCYSSIENNQEPNPQVNEVKEDSNNISDSLILGKWRLAKLHYAKISSKNNIGDNYHSRYSLSYEKKDIIIEIGIGNELILNDNTVGTWSQVSRNLSLKLNDSLDNFPIPIDDYAFKINANIMSLIRKDDDFKFTYVLVGF